MVTNMKLGPLNVRPFVMIVPEFPEKTVAIQKHLREIGIEAEEFPCFCAYDKLAAPAEPVSGLTTLHTYEVDAPGSGYRIGPKGVALCVSFLTFWTMAMFLPEDHFFFIEWDALFDPNWRERAEQALRDVPPDFDFLFLGSCCCEGKPTTHVKGEIYDVRYPMCNHAQIVAKKAMPTLLRTQRKIYAPADISLAFHAFPHLKVYTLLPRCANQSNTIIPP
jgi:hypothetical protein